MTASERFPPPGFRITSAIAGFRRQRTKVRINPPTLATATC
ncbi:hypothetical protein [Vitiosangium sp. GDMCC 1.1324]|nr:hypothetical protein [Vitiosangium sp. GDMCC 1.1324]